MYYKLTDEVIKAFKYALNSSLKRCLLGRSIGLSSNIDIRDVCGKAGISHTTYYRWMRAYGALSGKRGLTDTEKRLRQFGRAVDNAFAKLGNPPMSLQKQSLLSYRKLVSFPKKGPETSVPSMSSSVSVPKALGISDWEQITDELTGGVRCVEFVVKDSLKNM